MYALVCSPAAPTYETGSGCPAGGRNPVVKAPADSVQRGCEQAQRICCRSLLSDSGILSLMAISKEATRVKLPQPGWAHLWLLMLYPLHRLSPAPPEAGWGHFG